MKENNISTKDELIKNFTDEQLAIYNYYLSKYNAGSNTSSSSTSLIVADDKQVQMLEKGCKILEKVLKAEVVVGLIVVTLVFVFGGNSKAPEVKYKTASTSIYFDIDNQK